MFCLKKSFTRKINQNPTLSNLELNLRKNYIILRRVIRTCNNFGGYNAFQNVGIVIMIIIYESCDGIVSTRSFLTRGFRFNFS